MERISCKAPDRVLYMYCSTRTPAKNVTISFSLGSISPRVVPDDDSPVSLVVTYSRCQIVFEGILSLLIENLLNEFFCVFFVSHFTLS